MGGINSVQRWMLWRSVLDIKFIIDKENSRMDCLLDGRRIHSIISKSHLDEIKNVSDMTHLEDLAPYAKYLKTMGFWSISLPCLNHEVFYKKLT